MDCFIMPLATRGSLQILAKHDPGSMEKHIMIHQCINLQVVFPGP